MSDQRAIAKDLGDYVMSKVIPLQRSYCGGSGASSARARGKLAQLRHLNANTGSYVLMNGEELYGGWPEEPLRRHGASRRDEERAIHTVNSVLGLYALHQQSLARGCAVIRGKEEPTEEYLARLRRGSFGRACRAINDDLDEASGVQRRLMSIEGASNFEGVMVGVRALVRLMKSSRARSDDAAGEVVIALDYGGLTQDLYLIQVSEAWRVNVLERWARDYYAYVPEKLQ